MTQDEIKQIVDDLDRNISKENARVSIQKYGEDFDEVFIVATGNGYLRLGIEFLKAGFTPYISADKSLGKRPFAIDVEIDYLIAEDSDVNFDYFERREDIPVETYEETFGDRLVPVVIIGIMLLILALAIVGLIAIIKGMF